MLSISILFSLGSIRFLITTPKSLAIRSKRAAIAADLGISTTQPTRNARNTLRPFWWRSPHMDSKGNLRANLSQKTRRNESSAEIGGPLTTCTPRTVELRYHGLTWNNEIFKFRLRLNLSTRDTTSETSGKARHQPRSAFRANLHDTCQSLVRPKPTPRFTLSAERRSS